MKLISGYIENFGSLSRCEFTFNGGLTVLYAPNGGGKSTLAAFIKAMFYGLPADTSRSKFNERRHFYPFSGGKFGGNLTFEWKGKTYRVERFFDRASGDDVKVFSDGLPCDAFPDGQIGRSVFGLDEQSFVRTLYVTASPSPLAATGGITARLGENSSSASGGYDLASALSALERASKNLQSRGGRGRIAELEARVKRCKTEIANISAVSGRLGAKYAERAEVVSRLGELEKRERSAAELAAQKRAKLDDMYGAIAQKRARLAQIDGRFPLGLPTDEELSVLSAEGAKGGKKGASFSRLPTILSFILAALLIVGGAALMFFNTFVGAAALCAGAVFACFSFGILFLGRKDKKRAADGEAQRILKRYNLGGADCASAAEELSRTSAERKALLAEISSDEEKVRECFGSDSAVVQGDIGEADGLRRRLAAIDRDISDDESIVEGLGELQSAEREAAGQLEECKKRYQAYTAAAQLLKEAERSLTRDYVRPAAEAFSRYSSLLKSTLGSAVYLDKNFAVAFEGGGELRSEEHMSGGQRAIVGLCYRLALIDNIFGADRPFVLLDDPFCELDEEHMSRAAQLLNTLAKDRQIIYLYCHESRKV